MFDDYKITVEGVTKMEGSLNEFGTMLVHFHIESDRATFDMPVQVSRSLIPAEEWVGEAQGLLHLIFTELSKQTQIWARPQGEEDGS